MKCKDCVHYKLCRDLFCQVDILNDDDKRCDYFEEARPHGEWIEKCWNDPRYVDYECSVCKRSIMNGTPDFCPNCGADMREGEAE